MKKRGTSYIIYIYIYTLEIKKQTKTKNGTTIYPNIKKGKKRNNGKIYVYNQHIYKRVGKRRKN